MENSENKTALNTSEADKIKPMVLKERTAAKIMRQIQEQMIVTLPFLNRAVLRMPYLPLKEGDIPKETSGKGAKYGLPGTDGKGVRALPDCVINMYRRDATDLSRTFLHMILHCIFCHPFRYDMLNVELWDLSADIAVENVILELDKKEFRQNSDVKKKSFLFALGEKVQPLTAENIYGFYYKHPEEYEKDKGLAELFKADTHACWLSSNEFLGKEIIDNDAEDDYANGGVEQMWKKTAGSIKLQAEVFRRGQEFVPGAAVENIKELYKEKYDFADFLKRFVSPREEIKVNNDEFDYIYYTYGMKLYGNIPLIEPLEYTDMNKIHDFVIAIDTSGSCQGRIVRSFLNKTYTILKSTGTFFSNMNLHIIQCDSRIQSDDRITSQLEFDNYIADLKVRGYGGTDFRAVFDRIDKLIEDKEFTDLRGMIYFTDGLGTFPEKVPDYPAAFIIIEDDKEKPNIPPWAIKLVTTLEELEK